MNSLPSLAALGLSVCALAFVVWLAVSHPAHHSLYGPYAKQAKVAAAHGRG